MYDWLLSLGSISFSNPLVQAFAVAVVRSVAGWLNSSLEDGKITMYEWQELLKTMFRVIPQALGLSAFGIPATGALITDYLFNRIKDLQPTKK